MKTTIKNIAFALFAGVASVSISSCGNKSTESKDNAEAEHDHADGEHEHFACPMHADQVGHEGDTCPKCGMKLELVNAEQAANTNEYFMAYASEPAQLEAGKAAKLSLTPKIKGNEATPVPLDIEHDKKMHLIVVSADLSYFDHIHPEFQGTGNYDIKVIGKDEKFTARYANETRFDQGGDYILFADYKPTGANHQLERIPVTLTGTPYKAQKFTAQKSTSMVDGYEISFVPEGGKFVSEGTMHISAIVKKDGKEIPADQFENYLGAKAHVVMIKEDTQDYLHVHPEVVDGRLDLHTTFGKTGVFRSWLQFKAGGQIHTADFTLLVEQGKAPESTHDEGAAHGHEH
jgi:Heavy metal binding domain